VYEGIILVQELTPPVDYHELEQSLTCLMLNADEESVDTVGISK